MPRARDSTRNARPKLFDSAEPYNQTLIELRMTDLFPAPVMAGLEARFGAATTIAAPSLSNLAGSSPNLTSSSPNLAASSPNLTASSPNLADRRNPEGCLLSDQLSLPIIDDLARLSAPLRQRLEALAAEARSKGRVSREKMVAVVLALCAGHFITLRCLTGLVKRKPDTLRDQYLAGLVRERKLTLAFPKTPTHERQAYCASSALSE